MGSQRVASQIGISRIDLDDISVTAKHNGSQAATKNLEMVAEYFDKTLGSRLTEAELPPVDRYYPVEADIDITVGENPVKRDMYWYHPDYIGNVDLITDGSGRVYQFFMYNAFGENLYQWTQSSGDYNSPYRFNGKELDPETGNYYYGARYYDPKISVWLSVDPLAAKYPSWSPYTFVMNNPILFIDPDGREVYIHGADAQKAVAALQKKTSLQLSYDAKTGMLSAMGKAESKLDKELMGAIGDQGIKVNLYTTRENSFKSRDGSTQPILIGGYDGSEVKDGVVETTQYINMEHSEKAENAGVSNQGSDVFHEAIESYYGGQNDPGGIYDQKKWEESHNKAHEADPSAPEVNRNLNTKTGQTGLINPSNGKSVDLRPMTNGEKKAAGVK